MNQETKDLDKLDSERWQLVLKRARKWDGEFVYAVRSTGIYCRPSCPSRKPRRDLVEFFPQPRAAERAGFRPCRRCRPEVHGGGPQAEKIRVVREFIDAHIDEALTLKAIGKAVGLSPFHLQRLFKRIMGVTPKQYVEAHRINRFKSRVRKGNNVTDSLYEAGFGSSSRLYERTPSALGMTPTSYRERGRGVAITYTLTECPLGRLLLAATQRGVCRIAFGDRDVELESLLRKEFSAAQIRRDDEGLGPFVETLRRHFDGLQPRIELPLDIQATAFQRRVWSALCSIPYGESRSYSQVARDIGSPGAVRAVAHACATNPVAVAIPCHRVVQKDGGLGGYRGGVERKRFLLDREKQG